MAAISGKEQEEMTLHFIVNNFRLIVHTIESHRRQKLPIYQKDIMDFLKYAWETSPNCCQLIDGSFSVASSFDNEETFSRFCVTELVPFFATLEQSKEFAVLREQTEISMAHAKEQWEKNYPLTSHIMQDITGFDVGKALTAYITHPGLPNGKYLGNNILMWRHQEAWENYTTVYLWHEILHSYFDPGKVNHALIELVTDNELRIRLNQGTYPPFVGHNYLTPIKEKIFPYWQTYLHEIEEGKSGDILAFLSKIQKLPDAVFLL
jgi:hypothetical protein